MSATAALLDFAGAEHQLVGAARDAAERLLGDTLAVGAAGRGRAEGEGVIAAARSWGQSGDARLLGSADRLPASTAAFVNGFQIHCLEWDAVHEGAVVHALSVVTAALGAVIDRRGGCDPGEALAALAVGVDIASGLGLASSGAMRFFRPATAGVIGAALAAARIERVTCFADVLGLAYSQAAGTMQAHLEGSIALPLQIAHAARAAVSAVDLANAGLTGPHDALEGRYGFFQLFEEGSLDAYTDAIGDRWLIEEVSTKPFPSGRASHAILAALAELRRGETPVKIEAHVPPLVARLVDRPFRSDMSPAYARLCLPFLSALMLVDGRIDPRRFAAETFRSSAIADMADRVAVAVDGNGNPNALSPQRIILHFADGRREEKALPQTLGSPGSPLSQEQAQAKAGLARELAGSVPDARIFEDPLSYFAEPG